MPINDFICTSSVSGYLKVLDIPTFSKEVTLLRYKPATRGTFQVRRSLKPGEVYLDFMLPGSSHGFRTDNGLNPLFILAMKSVLMEEAF